MGCIEVSDVLLDTQALIWLLEDNPRIGSTAVRLAEQALANGRLCASAISFWEVAMLAVRKRIDITVAPDVWRQKALAQGVAEIPLSGRIAVTAVLLENFHPDPADRFVAATALEHDAVLITSDRKILDWQGPLARHDARL